MTMDKKKITPPKSISELAYRKGIQLPEPIIDPNELLQTFLKDNNLILTVSAISDNNSYIAGQGFVLTDKPLLLVTVKYK